MPNTLYTLQEFNLHDGDHEYTLNFIFKTKDHLVWKDKIIIEKNRISDILMLDFII